MFLHISHGTTTYHLPYSLHGLFCINLRKKHNCNLYIIVRIIIKKSAYHLAHFTNNNYHYYKDVPSHHIITLNYTDPVTCSQTTKSSENGPRSVQKTDNLGRRSLT